MRSRSTQHHIVIHMLHCMAIARTFSCSKSACISASVIASASACVPRRTELAACGALTLANPDHLLLPPRQAGPVTLCFGSADTAPATDLARSSSRLDLPGQCPNTAQPLAQPMCLRLATWRQNRCLVPAARAQRAQVSCCCCCYSGNTADCALEAAPDCVSEDRARCDASDGRLSATGASGSLLCRCGAGASGDGAVCSSLSCALPTPDRDCAVAVAAATACTSVRSIVKLH